jgi:uncharacterized cupredoxin-like copper-binding protein
MKQGRIRTAATLALAMASAGLAFAHGDAAHRAAGPAKKEQKKWGIAGDAKNARRTIEVGMTDDMRFTPSRIEVRQGETVRFVHKNKGQLMHEFVLGTKNELDQHAEMMRKFPNMEHDEPYMAHVPAGSEAEFVWTFNRAGDFDFACLIPGHYEAGMVGKVSVLAPARRPG